MSSNREALKAVFKTGNIPKEQDFANLIDASLNKADDGFLIVEKDGKKNVGVGVEVPQAKLHVGGDLKVDSGLTVEGVTNIPNMLKIGGPTKQTTSKLQVQGGAAIDSLIISADGKKESMIFDAGRLYVNTEHDSQDKPCKLRVGAAWGMPGLYSGDGFPNTRSTDLVLGAPANSKIYFGEAKNDAWIESGTGNAYIKGSIGIGKAPSTASNSKKLQVQGGAEIDSLTVTVDNISLPLNKEIFFADNGQIRSLDNNHRILFRRSENIMEFREFGNIVFSPGSTNGSATNKMTLKSDGNVEVAGNLNVTGLLSASGLSGPVNDYAKAHYTLSGGGTIKWSSGGWLSWNNRFIAIAMGKNSNIPAGHINIFQPDEKKLELWDSSAATTRMSDKGIALKDWEALYAIHTIGETENRVTFKIYYYNSKQEIPINWILVAVMNGDDKSLKLGTGATIPIGYTYKVGLLTAGTQ